MSETLNIPFGVPFLETLMDLISGKCGGDKIEIAKAKVLLPSRRSCRELRDIYLNKMSKNEAILLPRIHALGDVDVTEFSGGELADIREALMAMPSVMPEFKARIIAKKLMEEIYEKHFMNPPAPDFGGAVSYSLVSFLEEFETYEADFSEFPSLFEADISQHWQQLSSFIMDFTASWQKELHKRGCITAVRQRKLLMNFLSESWQKSPPDFHVFAAGSTGSIPASARFLKCVSSLPKGHVVIEGLDKTYADEIWESIGHSHFQNGLKILLEALGAGRNDVEDYSAIANKPAIAGAVFMPAEFYPGVKFSHELSNIIRIDADNLRQEAAIISLLMREVLEEDTKTAALITNNRSLARQVIAALKKFDVDVDDTAGIPLLKTPQGNFLMLLGTFITDLIAGNFSAELFLALLKHPLFVWNARNAVEIRKLARKIETDSFRNIKSPTSFEDLVKQEAGKVEAGGFLREFSEKVLKFSVAQQKLTDFSTLLQSHIELAVLFSDGKVYEKDEGENLKLHLEGLVQQSEGELAVSPAYYGQYLESFLEDKVFRPRYGGHPRLKILSPIEARLLNFDRIILGGMNDGSWPQLSTPNPWASEFMREKLGLPTIENRTGQSGHDFAAFISQKEVFLTRAEKEGGGPTTVSRFLARLSALKGDNAGEKEIASKWKALTESLSKPASVKPVAAPDPNPEIKDRSSVLRVTDLEILVRDPYEFYAKNILGLAPLDEISPEPDGSNFGTIIHTVLKRFSDNYDSISEDKKEAFIYEEAVRELQACKLPRKAYVLWLPRIRNIAEWIAKKEREIRPQLAKVLPEVSGRANINAGGKNIEIRGRADRLEIYKDGSEAVVDYKTGAAIPTKAEVVSGISSQLHAMAVMAGKGAFGDFGKNVSSIEYWQMTGRKHEKGKTSGYEISKSALVVAEEGIKKQLAAFLANEIPFAVSPLESLRKKYSDYEHLERCDEWE